MSKEEEPVEPEPETKTKKKTITSDGLEDAARAVHVWIEAARWDLALESFRSRVAG
jgi:hypothetical protein